MLNLPSSGASTASLWLSRFAWATAAVTALLLSVGGLVTSHGAGLSVPDWPNSYGYSMYTFPVSHWMGGILYEHSHRLLGVLVGLLTTILAVWMWARETTGPRRWTGILAMVVVAGLLGRMGEWQRPIFITLAALAPVAIAWGLVKWARAGDALRWLGVAAFAAVILQGTLGGLRVVWLADELGFVHGVVAQGFLVLICFIAWRAGPRWRAAAVGTSPARELWPAWLVAVILVVLQLMLGAAMRHRHAGLAVPDFPLAYGRVWPKTDADSVGRYNQIRVEATAQRPIEAADVLLHMLHRANACVIGAGAVWLLVRTRKRLGQSDPLSRLAIVWTCLVGIQIVLGATTVWTGKSADIATLHMAAGALTLVVTSFAAVLAKRAVSARTASSTSSRLSESVAGVPHIVPS